MVTIQCDGVEHTLHPMREQAAGERYWGNYHAVQIRDFYDRLRAGQPVPTQPQDATRTLAVVLGIYRSAREGKTVAPEY